eukprot:7928644-Pyramimonas_sp.AAC.1
MVPRRAQWVSTRLQWVSTGALRPVELPSEPEGNGHRRAREEAQGAQAGRQLLRFERRGPTWLLGLLPLRAHSGFKMANHTVDLDPVSFRTLPEVASPVCLAVVRGAVFSALGKFDGGEFAATSCLKKTAREPPETQGQGKQDVRNLPQGTKEEGRTHK